MTLEEAINKTDFGNCMLFTGAGFSKGAKGSDTNKELFSAWDFAQLFYKECTGAEEPQGNLEDVLQFYIETKGKFALIDYLKENFIAYRITPSQEYLGSISWKRIYTTNYDNKVVFVVDNYALHRKLFAHDYKSAYIFFENAYPFAEKRQKKNGASTNYTYQIDNHFARYLLEYEMKYGTKDTFISQFRKAHELLINPANKVIVRFYTYKVAQNYYRFYERYFKDLKDEERREFVRACNEMYRRAKWYIESDDEGFSRKVDVRKIIDEMLMVTSANNQYLK